MSHCEFTITASFHGQPAKPYSNGSRTAAPNQYTNSRRAHATLEQGRVLKRSSSTRSSSASVESCTTNTPRTRNAVIGNNIARPHRVVELNICDVPVKFEFFKFFSGLGPIKPRLDENVNKQLRRSIYFSGLPAQLPNDFVKELFKFFGRWEAIELHKKPGQRFTFGYVRFRTECSANFAMKNEVTILGMTLGYGDFRCVKTIADGFKVVENSSLFRTFE